MESSMDLTRMGFTSEQLRLATLEFKYQDRKRVGVLSCDKATELYHSTKKSFRVRDSVDEFVQRFNFHCDSSQTVDLTEFLQIMTNMVDPHDSTSAEYEPPALLARLGNAMGNFFGVNEDSELARWKSRGAILLQAESKDTFQMTGHLPSVSVDPGETIGDLHIRHVATNEIASLPDEDDTSSDDESDPIPDHTTQALANPVADSESSSAVTNADMASMAVFKTEHKGSAARVKLPKNYSYADWFGYDDYQERSTSERHVLLPGMDIMRAGTDADLHRKRGSGHRKLRYSPPTRNLPAKRNRQGAKLKKLDSDTERRLEQLPVFFPWFNIVSLVIMTICLIVAIVADGGFARIGVSIREVHGEFSVFGMTGKQNSSFYLADNMWIGPSSKILIEMGAKYSPCMRSDEKTLTSIRNQNADLESLNWGCCVLQDNTCSMTPNDLCQNMQIATQKWTANTTCSSLSCQIINRPCCLGQFGQCVHISQDQCEFSKGSWKHDQELCQKYATCLNDVCGMGGHPDPWHPCQWWRFFLPVFLHVGILHFLFNALFQLSVGIQIERSCGWLRFMIIFMISGVGGNIISGLFSPHTPQVGSSGALYGLLAVLLIELFQSWQLMASKKRHVNEQHPWKEVFKLGIVIFISLFLGTLPWIDNFAHLGGFLFGIPAAIVFLPYITFGKWDRRRKLLLVICGFIILTIMFVAGFVLFANKSETFCLWCLYFNCIPYSHGFCDVVQNWDGMFASIPYSMPPT